ncbi:thioredoxin [Anaerococcus sp.]|uniref:thioredoxin n=1 Tax=Anaerococcus sp. TaxID=1872515 RepID=UPI00257FF7D4|nr:thioredoxin [Anaerococcus sp.]MBS6105216.1 thioredoxin [Anaerococcus sp.]
MRELDTLEFRDEVEAGKGTCLVDFNATWCGPCKMQAPVLEELASEVDYPIYGIDVDEAEEIASEYNVNAVPSLMIFKDGKLQETLVGFQSKEVLEEAIGKYL